MAEILMSWDIESGAQLDLLRSRIRGKAGYVNVVIHNETAILVLSDDWIPQATAEETVKATLSEAEYKQMGTKRLVWIARGIGKPGNAPLAEQELIRRIQAQPEDGHLQGPAKLIHLEDGRLKFSSIDPFTDTTGQFLAYDVGYYD